MAEKTVPVLGERGVPDFTTRARGFDTSAIGTLFDSTARSVGNIIQAKDRAVKYNIGEEIAAGVAAINEEFVGVTRETNAGDLPVTTSMPADFQRDMKNIKKVRQKWESGKLTTSAMHTKAAAIAKQVKARYPGYTAEVDAELRSHGFNPANDILRENIAAAREAQSNARESATQEQRRKLSWVEKHLAQMPDDVRVKFALDPVAAANDPELWTRARVGVVEQQARLFKLETEKETLQAQKLRGEAVNERAIPVARNVVSTRLNQFLANDPAYNAYIASRERVESQALDPENRGIISSRDTTEMRNAAIVLRDRLTALKTTLRAELSNIIDQDDETQKQVFGLYDMMVNNLTSAIGDNNKNLLDSSIASTKALESEITANLFINNPQLLNVKAIVDAVGPDAYKYAMDRNIRILEENALLVSNAYAFANINRGEGPLGNSRSLTDVREHIFNNNFFATEEDKKAGFMMQYNLNLGVLQAPNSSKAAAEAAVRLFFSPENSEYMSRINPAERRKTYSELTSPVVVSTLKGYINKGILPQEVLTQYNNWVSRSFNIVSKPVSDNINQFNQSSNFAEIFLNDKTGLFEVRMKAKVPGERGGGLENMARSNFEVGRNLADQMNVFVRPLRDASKATGENNHTQFIRSIIPGVLSMTDDLPNTTTTRSLDEVPTMADSDAAVRELERRGQEGQLFNEGGGENVPNPFGGEPLESEPKTAWLPPADAEQVQGAGVLPLGLYKTPNGESTIALGLPQGLLDSFRAFQYMTGQRQDPDAPGGYMREGRIQQVSDGISSALLVSSVFNKSPKGSLSAFAGRRSRTFDEEKFNRAIELDSQGKSNEDIRQETGWFKGMDGDWRYEISDRDMKITVPPGQGNSPVVEGKVGNLIHHPALFAAYPELKEIPLRIEYSKVQSGATYITEDSSRIAGIVAKGATEQEVRHVIAHELAGHGVQFLESFASGGSVQQFIPEVRSLIEARDLAEKNLERTSQFLALDPDNPGLKQQFRRHLETYQKTQNKLDEEFPDEYPIPGRDEIFTRAYYAYKSLAGEIEAEDVGNRQTWTDNTRQEIPPKLKPRNREKPIIQ